MSTDTKIKTLIFNKLTQEQYNNADRVPTEFYLTPDTSIDSSEKGAANGIATLDSNAKVPAEQIPTATTSTLGGVKPDGNTITVTEDGTISATISGELVATKAELQAVDSSKADTSLSNTIPSKSFKEMSVGWGMPDTTAEVSITQGQNYTAPCDLLAFGRSTSTADSRVQISINGVKVMGVTSSSYDNEVCACAFVPKGATFIVSNNHPAQTAYFPLKGALK